MSLGFPTVMTKRTSTSVSIAASTWRWDGVSGSVLVSSGFPLKPGQVTSTNLSKVRVYVNSVEQAVAIQALRGTWPDGSYRSIGIQFTYTLTNDTPVTSSVDIGTSSRGTSDVAWTEPTKTMVDKRAVIAPTATSHLCGTLVTLQPLNPTSADTGQAASWNAQLEALWTGQTATGQQAGTAIYDHQNGLWAYYCRTGTRSWYQNAYDWTVAVAGGEGGLHANSVYLQLIPYTVPATADHATYTNNAIFNPDLINGLNNGGPAEQYSVRMISCVSGYWMTAWRQPIRHISFMSNRAASLSFIGAPTYATARDFWLNSVGGHRYNLQWFLAMLCGYLVESTTELTSAGSVSAADFDYPTQLPWMIDALEYYTYALVDYRDGLVGKRSSAHDDMLAFGNYQDLSDFPTFWLALTATHLMLYYDHVKPDSRIPGIMQKIGDFLITQFRASASGEIGYPTTYIHHYLTSTVASVSESNRFADDVIPYTMPMFGSIFGWLYAYTANSTYLTWLDRCIEPANLTGIIMLTKYWGQWFGLTQQSFSYYRAGGSVRGISGAHPVAIITPPAHASLG